MLKQSLVNDKSKCCRSCSKTIINWDENKTELEIKKIIDKLKKFPSKSEIKKHCPELISQINKHEGMNKFREKLNHKIIKRKQNYWKDFETLKIHLFKNFSNLLNRGIFPTTKMLSSVSLAMAVQKHGESKKVAELMNCKIESCLITSDGHYVNSGNEYILDEYLYHHGIEHEVDGKISNLTNHRYDFKIKDFFIEIWGYENSKTERCEKYQEKRKIKESIYKKLNLKMISIEKDVFSKSLEQINIYFDRLFKEIKIPINLNADQKFNIKNTIKNTIKNCRYWNEEKIAIELTKIFNETNKFPTSTFLFKSKRFDLLNAIRRNGGFFKFRKILNCKSNKKENGYWKDINNVIKEIKIHISEFKKFPSYKDLYKIKKHSLAKAIVDHGGTIYFKKIILEEK